MNRSPSLFLVLCAALAAGTGCLSIKTEHEVKPIKIEMDVNLNLKVDKEIDRDLAEEQRKPPRHLDEIKAMLDRKDVGVDAHGYLVVRGKVSDEERDILDDVNASRRVRMREIAEKTGATRSAVELRRAEKMLERLPAGSLYEKADGTWTAKE